MTANIPTDSLASLSKSAKSETYPEIPHNSLPLTPPEHPTPLVPLDHAALRQELAAKITTEISLINLALKALTSRKKAKEGVLEDPQVLIQTATCNLSKILITNSHLLQELENTKTDLSAKALKLIFVDILEKSPKVTKASKLVILQTLHIFLKSQKDVKDIISKDLHLQILSYVINLIPEMKNSAKEEEVNYALNSQLLEIFLNLLDTPRLIEHVRGEPEIHKQALTAISALWPFGKSPEPLEEDKIVILSIWQSLICHKGFQGNLAEKLQIHLAHKILDILNSKDLSALLNNRALKLLSALTFDNNQLNNYLLNDNQEILLSILKKLNDTLTSIFNLYNDSEYSYALSENYFSQSTLRILHNLSYSEQFINDIVKHAPTMHISLLNALNLLLPLISLNKLPPETQSLLIKTLNNLCFSESAATNLLKRDPALHITLLKQIKEVLLALHNREYAEEVQTLLIKSLNILTFGPNIKLMENLLKTDPLLHVNLLEYLTQLVPLIKTPLLIPKAKAQILQTLKNLTFGDQAIDNLINLNSALHIHLLTYLTDLITALPHKKFSLEEQILILKDINHLTFSFNFRSINNLIKHDALLHISLLRELTNLLPLILSYEITDELLIPVLQNLKHLIYGERLINNLLRYEPDLHITLLKYLTSFLTHKTPKKLKPGVYTLLLKTLNTLTFGADLSENLINKAPSMHLKLLTYLEQMVPDIQEQKIPKEEQIILIKTLKGLTFGLNIRVTNNLLDNDPQLHARLLQSLTSLIPLISTNILPHEAYLFLLQILNNLIFSEKLRSNLVKQDPNNYLNLLANLTQLLPLISKQKFSKDTQIILLQTFNNLTFENELLLLLARKAPKLYIELSQNLLKVLTVIEISELEPKIRLILSRLKKGATQPALLA